MDTSYRSDYVELFNKCCKSIVDLPVLDLGERQGNTDYIDFIKVSEMSYPVMRFVDVHERPGVVFRLKNKQSGNMLTVSLFKRYNDDDRWNYAVNGGIFTECYYEKINSGTSVYTDPLPYQTMCDELITNLLNGTDECFEVC